MDIFNIKQKIGYALMRGGQALIGGPGGLMEGLVLKGHFSADLFNARGKFLKRFHGHNGITIIGKNRTLDTMFGKGTPVSQIDPWYIGLVNNSPTPVFAEADTLASHTGWTEWTSYSGNRKAWDDADASAKVKSTSSVSAFTMSAPGTINGILIAGVASGTGSVLWSTGSFDETVDVAISDVLNVSYGLRT